jgi:hypothetical protein
MFFNIISKKHRLISLSSLTTVLLESILIMEASEVVIDAEVTFQSTLLPYNNNDDLMLTHGWRPPIDELSVLSLADVNEEVNEEVTTSSSGYTPPPPYHNNETNPLLVIPSTVTARWDTEMLAEFALPHHTPNQGDADVVPPLPECTLDGETSRKRVRKEDEEEGEDVVDTTPPKRQRVRRIITPDSDEETEDEGEATGN